MAVIEILALIVVLLLVVYKWSMGKFNTLKDRGVPHKQPLPLFGTLSPKMLLGQDSFIRITLSQYKEYENCKFYGNYNFHEPLIVLRDLDMIKMVGIKDFDIFPNHKTIADVEPDNVFAKGLIALTNRKWKNMRTTLSPSFTGSKMRLMYELINECSKEAVNSVLEDLQAKGEQQIELNMKDYFTRYANDVIATAAFGLKVNSFKHKTNEFYTVGKNMSKFDVLAIIRIFMYMLFPKLMKRLGLKPQDETKTKYFSNLVLDAMKYRNEHDIIRPDMIQLLMEAKHKFDQLKPEEKVDYADFDDQEMIVAQCLLFFLAGFETVSTCLCFTAYELSQNLDVQQKLYEEILEMEQQLNGQPLTYDALMKIKYLDMVLSESLRKWPPAVATDRMCAADNYALRDADGNVQLQLKKGDQVVIPIIGIQRDAQYFAEPGKFMPERFSDENRHEINPLTYLPFGLGPRNCIGNRFALMETKSLLYHLLLKFKILPSERTCKDLLNSIKGFQSAPKTDYWNYLVPRSE